MKGLQWTTLNERKAATTMFAKLDIGSIKLDFMEIESQFAAKVVEVKKGTYLLFYIFRFKLTDQFLDLNEKKKAGPISILDPKISQAMCM